MYCGSCLRDNALAAALLARGHDVVLSPVYTPTRTDERNVSQDQVFFGGISVFLEQYAAVFRHTPRALDRLWDSQWALRLASKRQIKLDPKDLGEMTVSMLKGEQGFQAKEISKLLDWLRHEPRFDIIIIPYSLLLGLAEPFKRELKVPVGCTLQGDDLFLEGLGSPYKQESLDLIRVGRALRRRVLSGERVLSWVHAVVSRNPCRADARHPDRHQSRGLQPPCPAQQQSVHDRLLRAHRAREGLPRSVRRVRAASRAARVGRGTACGCRIPAARAQGLSGPDARDTRRRGSRRRVRVPRRDGSCWRRSGSSRTSMCSRFRPSTKSRRDCSCSRRWPAAFPSSSRDAVHFQKSCRKQGAG